MARPKKFVSGDSGPVVEDSRTAAELSAPAIMPTTVTLAEVLAANARLMEQNQALMVALLANREAPRDKEIPDGTVRIENLLGVALSFMVSDPKTGIPRHISLESRGAFALILQSQVEQIKEKYPHYFNDGYLSTPTVAENANTIRNFRTFLAELPDEQITDRIGQITSSAVLFDLYNHIENQRFEHLDVNGNPFTEKEGEVLRLVLKENPISLKLAAVERALQRRIAELTNVRVSLDA